MCVRMVSEQMSARGNFPDQIGAGARKFSNQEKCRASGVAVEQIEESRGNGRVGAIIECQRERLGRCRMPNRGAKQFRRRANGAPSCDSRSRTRGQNERPRIHYASTAIDFRTALLGIPASVLACSEPLSDKPDLGTWQSGHGRLAASTTFNSLLFTRTSACTRRSSFSFVPILPMRPPSEAARQGTFLSRRKGDIIIEVQ